MTMMCKEFDTAVIGGGLAGCAAAIASARLGCKTVLIEQSGVLGGQATLGIVTPIASVTTNPTDGKPTTDFGGICSEVYHYAKQMSLKYGSPKNSDPVMTEINPHITKYVLLKKCLDSGVEVMFHAVVTDSAQTDTKITSVTVSTKSGSRCIAAKAFIDASGDADLVRMSGAPYHIGCEENAYAMLKDEGFAKSHVETLFDGKQDDCNVNITSGQMQPVSVFFRIGGVDRERVSELNNRVLTYENTGIDREKLEKSAFFGRCGFEPDGDRIPMPQGRVLVFPGSAPGTAAINMSRVINIDATDCDSLNMGEYLAQEQVINLMDFLQNFVPGFENAYLLESANTLGIRESARMVGRYMLTGADVIECRRFDDAVAYGSYIIDIHNPNGSTSGAIGGKIKEDYYDIPLRCLCSAKYSNLFAAGRCISADHVAHSSSRVQGTCLMTGEVAGTAAAVICGTGETDITKIQAILRKNGALFA